MLAVPPRAWRRVRSGHGRRAMVATLLLTARVSAQDTTPLLLGDVLRDVAELNPKIAAARALAQATARRVGTTSRPPDPELQLGVMNRSLPSLRPMDPLGMVQLQVMQMVPWRGKLRSASQAAGADAAAAGARGDETAWEVRTSAAMAWYDLYVAHRALEISRTSFLLLHEARQVATAMYRVGDGQQADVLRAGVAIARMEADTIRMRGMRSAMIARLNALRGDREDSLRGAPQLPAFPQELPALATLVASIEQRPMLRAGRLAVDAASHRATLARREAWPDLTVGVQLGQQRASMPPAIAPDGTLMPGERQRERMGSLMIGAALPIFASQRQHQMRDEAAAMTRMAAADLQAMRADTRAQVVEAHAGLVRARQLATLYRSSLLPQAQAAAAAAAAAYRVGTVDFMTLLDNQMALNELQEQLATVEADEGRAWAELEMLTAQPLVALPTGGIR